MIALGVGFASRCDAPELADLAAGVWRQVPAGQGPTGPACIATLARKRESGLLEMVAARLNLAPLYLETADLAPFQEGRSLSPRAEAEVGAGSVAEAAALAAAGPGARLVVAKTASPHATCAAALAPQPQELPFTKDTESP